MTSRTTQQILPLTSSPHSAKRDQVFFKFESTRLRRLAELMRPAVPTEVFACYWSFAAERQNIFFGRYHRLPAPWTVDTILAEHRFTNAYRVSDRVSQYLLSHVQYNRAWSQEDLFFRTILFKFFNRRSTWDLLVREFGEPRAATFSPERYGQVLETAVRRGARIYSAAYIMPSGGSRSGYRRKHNMHLNLLARMIADGMPAKIARVKSMAAAFGLLRSYSSIGDFLAYQYVTDLNYSSLTNFSETEFVRAGPGAKEGIGKCFRSLGGKDPEWIIQRTAAVQAEAFATLGLKFRDLWGRPLQWIDCQNLFCEIAKYARVRFPELNGATGRTRIKQKFVASAEPVDYFPPPKWNLSTPPLRDVARD